MKNEMGFLLKTNVFRFDNFLKVVKSKNIIRFRNYFSPKTSVKTLLCVPFGNSNFSLKANVGAI